MVSPSDWIALENLALREIGRVYEEFNQTWFAGSLRRPLFLLHDGVSLWGAWRRDERSISLSRGLLREHAWCRVLGVLKHEMTHQYIQEVLGMEDSSDHGPLFRRLCREKQIESLGELGLGEDSKDSDPRVIDKVHKLLSLAGSSNRHEAEVAMQKANEIMLRYNLDLLNSDRDRGFQVVQLGRPGRVGACAKLISVILQEFFFVETLWVAVYDVARARRGRVLEILGTPENLEIAGYVHDYLNHCLEASWRDHSRKHPEASGSNYRYGLLLGFYEKLDGQREQRRASSTELVWSGDPELDRMFRRRHPRVRRMANSSMQLERESLDAGRRDGRQLRLNKGMYESRSAGRRLPAGEQLA